MSLPLDELYFTWLYGQVGSVRQRNKARTHWELAKQLFTKEFVWLVPHDDNRIEDAREIRYLFLQEQGVEEVDPNWLDLGCSMFELLLGLSRRFAFEADGDPREWFWHFLGNLDIAKYTDDRYDTGVHAHVDEVLERVIHRNYRYNGTGGIFPLKAPPDDQRRTELWYQMSAYLIERSN